MSEKDEPEDRVTQLSGSVFPARYELIRLLGRGGGGEVWEARDRTSGQSVALKALNTGFHRSEADALVRETTTLSGLEGLGFPRVLHLGRAADGRLYVVREMVDGESLRHVEEQDPRRALSLLASTASLLAVVHRAGLLHGDVKPENVIVRRDGGVSLVDLGLATSLREGGQSSLGLTPHYAAPELLSGGALTVQAEVYSLGIALRDLLSLGADMDLSESASRACVAVADRATSASPSARYPSVDEFAQALRAALGGDVALADDLGPPWPVLGLEATAYQLNKRILESPPGSRLLVGAPPLAGLSTLFRRAAWGLSVGEQKGLYFENSALHAESFREELLSAVGPEVVLFLDAHSLSEGQEALLQEVLASGARAVLHAQPGAPSDFEVPPLELPIVRQLLRGALPGMPEELVAYVVSRVGARPGALRQFVRDALGLPVATIPDVKRILSGTLDDLGSVSEVVEARLDRGHYQAVRELLLQLEEDTAHTHWLRARHELAAGTAALALEACKRALSLFPEAALSERIKATLARAYLGVGDYESALSSVKDAERFHPEARAEGLAYRGLALTLLGNNEKAQQTLETGLVVAKESGSQRLIALAGASLATAQWRAGQHEGAEESYRAAIAAAREVGDSGMLASTQINLAGLMKERGDLAASIELLEGAVDAARRAGRTTSLQQALLNLSNTDLYLGRLERARSQIARVGLPEDLTPALRAQLYGLKAELSARENDVEGALVAYDQCRLAWQELGRRTDASEAALESVLVASGVTAEGPTSSRFVPTLEQLEHLLTLGRELLQGEVNALLHLAEARVHYFAGREAEAEKAAERARRKAEEGGNREWSWRASALLSLLYEAAGKRTRAAKVRQDAVEVLEEIGARLPQDLREVYWSEPRRRAMRLSGSPASGSQIPAHPRSFSGDVPSEFATGSGTDAISRQTMTPLERRLARVLAINSDLAGEVDLSRLATKIVGHACELLKAERGYLLLGTKGDDLRVCASRGGQGDGHKEFSRSIAAEVLSLGKPLVSVDAGRDQRLKAYESVHLSLVSAVACVPVLSPHGTPIGALYIETRTAARPGFAEEIPTLQAFADQAAIALENSRLLAELRQKTEELTERNEHLKDARARLKELLGKRTARLREVKRELRTTKTQLSQHSAYGGMVGASTAMRRLYSLIDRVKDTDVPVLITGESGTGKEVAARAIHEGSARENGRMLAVNCGAIPESILESELFGHVRGAFTGADRDRKGLFREAEGGVLFLDEIGEMPLKMQASLLRVLQESKVRPVGGEQETSINVRVIFATNRNLQVAVREGRFREDLLYRIQVVELCLPPLRERREDIPLLCDHFLQRFATRFGSEKKSLSRAALAKLMEHPFPGNIRQLENALLNAWVMCEDATIEASDLELPPVASADSPPSSAAPPPSSGRVLQSSHHQSAKGRASSSVHTMTDKTGTLSEHQRGERRRIVDALEKTGWNRMKAAALLDLPRRTFYRRLREYNIQ